MVIILNILPKNYEELKVLQKNTQIKNLILYRFVILLLLNLLNKLSRNDTNSYESQCFGLNVKATKKLSLN